MTTHDEELSRLAARVEELETAINRAVSGCEGEVTGERLATLADLVKHLPPDLESPSGIAPDYAESAE